MCGICGLYTPNSVWNVNESLLLKMRDSMIHRGPDDAGIYINRDKKMGLGHRRLSIIDLSPSGHQPMSNEDDTVWITYNGEIYNFEELRKHLETRGHQFKSKSDTEVLIHLYEDHGERMLHRLTGMFAFAIWDSKKKKLFLARDRIGIKPLYYASVNGKFLFASEIKGMLASRLISPNLNREALYQYLAFGRVHAPLTMFENVYKLEPGHFMTIDDKGQIRIDQYWDIFDDVYKSNNEDEVDYIEMSLTGLRESVQSHMVSDVPVGIFLSGGVDSSLISALAAETDGIPLKTFTLGFKGYEKYNELVYARKVARLLNAEAYEILLEPKDATDFFSKFLEYQEEPVNNPTWMAVYFLSKLARENGVKVVLSGDGGDELFAGYNRWMHYLKFYNRVWKHYKKVPQLLRQANLSLVGPFIKDVPKYELLRRSAYNQELFWSGSAFKTQELNVLLNKNMLRDMEKHRPYDSIEYYKKLFDGTNHSHNYLDWMSYLSLKTSLLEDFLMRLDKMGMAASVEGRVPFLDHEFVSSAQSISPELKYQNYENKYLLKKVACRVLPSEIVYRRKMGFCVPVEEWLLGESKEFLTESIAQLEKQQDIFNKNGLAKLLNAFEKGSGNSFAFWGLITLALWYGKWMGNGSHE